MQLKFYNRKQNVILMSECGVLSFDPTKLMTGVIVCQCTSVHTHTHTHKKSSHTDQVKSTTFYSIFCEYIYGLNQSHFTEQNI